MKRQFFLLAFLIQSSVLLFAHGVAVINATTGVYLKMESTSQTVTVYDQVAEIVSVQQFKNLTGEDVVIKYAFPLHEEASATGMRWLINNIWYNAVFAPSPQDTTLPGGGDPDPDLLEYLGESPLFFSIPDTLAADSSIVVELTYVELLPYNFSVVGFDYPNKYTLIQNTYINQQHLHFILESQRQIEGIEFPGFPAATIINTGFHAEIINDIFEAPANQNYQISYTLNSDELGLFSYSNYLPDTLTVCDSIGNGFFTFIVEPDPGDTTQVIDKVFTLIIDQSGSMSGNKMVQAKEAASYIVENLNEGDYFNIVSFESEVFSFMADHVPYNPTTRQQALNYINALMAGGATNISGAFHTTIEDFAGNDTTQANIIIFFTDGQPTAGLTGTTEILNYIQNQLTYYEVSSLIINTFGIGEDVNQSLLSQIASQNKGLCEFLLNNELEQMITEFYLKIRNPVLLNINMSFEPPIVTEAFPNPLPNLYLGQQLIVSGRYDTTGIVGVTLSGQAFGNTITYSYTMSLIDTLNYNYMFLTKLWAKRKIDNLFIEYFIYPEGSPEAEEIKNEIIDISMCYNVSSPFTHFTGGGGGAVSVEEQETEICETEKVTAFPNPFITETVIKFYVESGNFRDNATVKIFDNQGILIHLLYVPISHSGIYEVSWDGCNDHGNPVPNGLYTIQVMFNGKIMNGSLIKAK